MIALLIVFGCLLWIMYHKGIEEGRRRQRRDNGENVATVTKIWERKR